MLYIEMDIYSDLMKFSSLKLLTGGLRWPEALVFPVLRGGGGGRGRSGGQEPQALAGGGRGCHTL